MNYLNKRSAWWLLCGSLLLMVLSTACGSGATPVVQQLRIVNGGNENIKGLMVLFPGATSTAEATQVEFGDVAAGETTAYRDVPSGVYRYAAYAYILEGKTVTQPVIDWVGESPMAGTQFTYRVKLDPKNVMGGQIELIETLVDAP